ncbi:MAG: serine/threonine protein phosphatase, partial [Hyphomonadaceae bacterium]|nr:serine/threonine protein phosphatase [Hyphomonadaceae bacterium]
EPGEKVGVIKTAYFKVREWSESGWHQARSSYLAAYDRVREFLIDLDAQTRPERGRPRENPKRKRERPDPKFQPPRKANVPADTRVYAIGDIHGRADLLRRLMNLIHEDVAKSSESRVVVIFLGDYVDRGFQSKDVIDYLLSDELAQYETYFLKGNHEAAFENFLSDHTFGPQWARFGGAETLMSYGIQPPRAKTISTEWEEVCHQLNEQIPMQHRGFLGSLSLYATLGDYVFVHAGLRPGLTLDKQAEKDILWIREDFLKDEGAFDRVVVHGHTPISAPHHDFRRIGIDTGAYLTGTLTAVCLVGSEVTFLST